MPDDRAAATKNLFPVEIPEYVKAKMRTFFKPDPADILSRPAPMFGGKSAAWFVADGDGTWDDVLQKYEVMLSYQVTD